ncbi:MAG: sugar phosphate isomerase/epimerase [Capsulimonadaceae bacterium]|nr:sugar phosphate isomerase/epimerase [Capsulimonadaceae bacterium]
MSDIKSVIGVQSYCFRGFKDNAKVASLVREIGVNAIELCGVHIDFNNESVFDSVIKTYRDAGVQIVSIGVQGFNGDEAKERQWFEFAKRAGAKFISAHFATGTIPQSYRVVEKLSAEFDIKVGVHNHGGRHWLGSAELLSWVFSQTNNRIGLTLDTAWALDAGENPLAMAEKFGDRLYGIHVKDFIFDRARKPEDVVVGTGNLDLPGLLKVLDKVKFDGFAVIEYEGDVENPVPALKKCVQQIKNA